MYTGGTVHSGVGVNDGREEKNNGTEVYHSHIF